MDDVRCTHEIKVDRFRRQETKMPFLEASNLPSTLAGSRLVIQQYEKMFALLEQTVKE